MAPNEYLLHIDFAAITKLDFTPLLADPKDFRPLLLVLCRPYLAANINKVACAESIGFILSSAVAAERKLRVIPIRKAGRLSNIKCNVAPQPFVGCAGESRGFEINKALIAQWDRFVLIDDLV